MRYFSILFFVTVFSCLLFSQNLVIEGTVKDKETGKSLPLANVFISENKNETLTDDSGNFKFFDVRPGFYTLIFSHIGYKTVKLKTAVIPGAKINLKISLSPSPISIGEVPVYSTKNISLLNNQPLPVDIITASDIKNKNYISVPGILQNEPGLALGRDGIWGTQLSIRGLSKSSIIILVDGNRVETANDIAAALSLIDVNDIERIEVIKGAASSIYGTGALGGVVNIITKTGSYNNNFSIGGSASGSFATVNNENDENVSLEAGAQNWYARLNSSFRKAGNANTPRGYIPNSQFADNNISFSAGFKPSDNQELSVKYQNFYAKDVGIPGGNLLFPANAVVTYPNEQRQMFSAEYKISNLSETVSKISAKYFYQVISRNVNNIPFMTKYISTPAGQPDKIMNVNLIHPHAMHYTNGIQLESGLILNNNNYLTFGLDAWQRSLDSRRERYITIENVDKISQKVLGTVKQIIGERPLPESQFQSGGIYAQDEYILIKDKLKLLLGGRIDRINISNKKLSNPVYTITNGIIDNSPASAQLQWNAENVNNTSWSGNAGLLYTVSTGFNLSLSLAKSFRSPSLEERYQFIDLGNLVELGNPDLSPEKGYFADLGTKIWGDNLSVNFDVFANNITDLVVQKSGTYQGRPALINTNIGKALLYGFDSGFEYNAINNIVLYGDASFVRGRDTEKNQNLPQIPPLNGRLGIRTPVLNYFNIDFSSTIFAAQNKIAEGEITTPGYTYFDLYVYTKNLTAGYLNFQISAGAENIFNKAYRNHLATNRGSVTVEPGMNIFIKTLINW